MFHLTPEDRLSKATASESVLLQLMNLGTFLKACEAIRSMSGVPNLAKIFLATLSFRDQSAMATLQEAPSAKRFS